MSSDEDRQRLKYNKGRYVLFSDESSMRLVGLAAKTLDMVQFTRRTRRPDLFRQTVLRAADGKMADEPYRVVCEALKKTNCQPWQITISGRSLYRPP